MKNYTVIILLVSFFTLSVSADNNVSLVHKNNNLLLLDPGHNQKRGKDKSVLELYYGLESSVALKYNLPPGQTSYTERLYLMIGSGFDSDMFLKIGILGNPTKRNQNLSSFPNPKSRIASFFKAWRYVMKRVGIPALTIIGRSSAKTKYTIDICFSFLSSLHATLNGRQFTRPVFMTTLHHIV